MIIKNNNMARKGISLVLALTMMMPTSAFAGTHTANNWDEYKEKLENDIMKQDNEIIINFNGSETFISEYSARLKIEQEYNKAMEEIPKHFSELNIIEKTTVPLLAGTSNAPLKSVTHSIKYNNSAVDFAEINTILNNEYNTIRTKVTDYEKIKSAYDYVVGALSNDDGIKVPRIKEILFPQGYNAHALLFGMMMTELGYDNDLATRLDGTKWNIVKVQGLWYHVDGRLETNEGNIVNDNQFLISKEDYSAYWDSDISEDENEQFSKTKYDGNPATVPQLKYEIKLIEEEIENMLKNLENIFYGISIEQINEIKNKIYVIKERVEKYVETINILRAEVNKIEDVSQKSDLSKALDDLISTSITDITIKASEKEAVIVALGKAVEAVVKAEITKSDIDIEAAFNAVEVVTENDNIDIKNLKASLTNRINATNDEIYARLAVEGAEALLRNLKNNGFIDDNEIKSVEDAIAKVTIDLVKTQLQNRINDVRTANESVKSVNTAEISITNIPVEGSLAGIIANAEAVVKTAEAEILKIKDIAVRTNQQNRIKAIKLVIAGIKAVNKAETTVPLKITYVTSAGTAVDKIVNVDHNDIKGVLNDRLGKVESLIMVADAVIKAEKAVEKAEKYMKDIDIALARDAVIALTDGAAKDALNKRIVVIYAVKAVEIAEKSMEDGDITSAKKNIFQVTDSTIKGKLYNRIDATVAIIKAASSLSNYLVEFTEVNKSNLDEAIDAANSAIIKVLDSKIQTELLNKLEGIISQKEAKENEINAYNAVEDAKNSLKDISTISNQNIEAVAKAVVEINKLPTGATKTTFQTTIKELNIAIKAKQTVENSEVKMNNTTLTATDVIAAEKAVLNISLDYKPGLDDRVKGLRIAFENKVANDLLEKAKVAVEKAQETRTTTDIASAKKAILLVKDIDEKTSLTKLIEELEVQKAEDAMSYAEKTRLTTDITAAKVAIAAISIKEDYEEQKENLNTRIKAMESYLATIKVLENAEKYRNLENVSTAEIALNDFKAEVKNVPIINNSIYNTMITAIENRIKSIRTYLLDVAEDVRTALVAVETAEEAMTVSTEPNNVLIQEAQNAVYKVTDTILKAGLQKRIDAIQIVKDAKLSVAKAVAYPNEKSVKDAETALAKVDGRYSDIIKHLSEEIVKVRNILDIAKKVIEASSLVQKAVESRKKSDSINARFSVDSLKGLSPDSHARFTAILNELDLSIDNASGIEADALVAAKAAIKGAIEIIGETNTYIAQIIEGKEIIEAENGEKIDKIQEAYKKIESAKIEVIKANASVRKLNDQKALLAEIDYANKEIELAEDNIDVKEAVRLVTKSSSSVNAAITEDEKSLAKLDIAAARRAVDKIGHINNKAIKATILNTINSIEKKLTTDNDQELIDAAVLKVNEAASMVTTAVRDNKVIADQAVIDKTIFAAKLAIGWISDNNKDAKATLTGFINDIEAMFLAEKDGIQNEERIKNAENAVIEAESKKGSDELESYIRSARLRLKIIKNDGPETEVKIDDLNARLDILEGKTDGSSGDNGSGGNVKPGENNSGVPKPGGSSTGNIIPTTPLPDSKRDIGTTEPIWGKTKELKKANPTSGLSMQDMTAIRVNESKLKTIELSNVLKTTSGTNARLVVRGKNIKLDSKPYINDKINNSILLPVKILGDELGFTVSLIDNPISYGAKRLLINGLVYGESKSIIMDIGSEYCYVNGNLIKISSKPVIQEGRTYIPVDFMVEHLGLTFSHYNDGGIVQLIIN